MDITMLGKVKRNKWIESLELLFKACEPLTFDGLLTKEEIENRKRNIEKHVFYCCYVRESIDKGVEPLSYDGFHERKLQKLEDLVSSETEFNDISNRLTEMYKVNPKKD